MTVYFYKSQYHKVHTKQNESKKKTNNTTKYIPQLRDVRKEQSISKAREKANTQIRRQSHECEQQLRKTN